MNLEEEKKIAYNEMVSLLTNCFNDGSIFSIKEIKKEDFKNACSMLAKTKENKEDVLFNLLSYSTDIITTAWSLHLLYVSQNFNKNNLN